MSNIIQIQDLEIPQLDLYARLSEVQLLRYYEPEEGIFIAESPKAVSYTHLDVYKRQIKRRLRENSQLQHL